MDGRCVLAVDLGTSGPKAVLVDVDGQVLGHAFVPVATHLSAGGGAEQDPDAWWSGVRQGCAALWAARPDAAARVLAVAVTGQWSGTVPVGADGRPTHRAITWLDSRGAAYLGAVTGGPLRVAGYDVRRLRGFVTIAGGLPSHSGKDPTAHIRWLRATRPDVDRVTSTFLEPVDYLTLVLTGRRVSTPDAIAAHWVTDNRDLSAVDYHPRLLAWSGLERERLPDLVPSASVVGELLPAPAADLGLAAGTPVVTATGDIHAAVLGSGAVADHRPHLYLGTSSWLSCHVPGKATDIRHNQTTLPSALPGRYFVANEHETAGACLTWLRDNVLFHRDDLAQAQAAPPGFAAFDALAGQRPAGSNGVLFTPWLNGERTPVDDYTLRAGFHHLSLATERGDLVRAVLEGVAYNSRWLLSVVESFTGHRMDAIHAIGGGARSAVWCQIHADVLDRQVRQVDAPQQATPRGAAFVALLALGLARPADLADRVAVRATYHPDPATRDAHDAGFASFTDLYRRTRSWHRRRAARFAGAP